MNTSNVHFEIYFEKLTQDNDNQKSLPVDESVISMETEFELEEKNFLVCWLDLMQSRHNATLDLF